MLKDESNFDEFITIAYSNDIETHEFEFKSNKGLKDYEKFIMGIKSKTQPSQFDNVFKKVKEIL
jgi:hypothetical protein